MKNDEKMFVDIHSHLKKTTNNLVFIVGKHCLGIHPWELMTPFNELDTSMKFEQLKNYSSEKMLGIGECGLDRRRKGIVSIEEQMKVFLWHMQWALKEKLPLIIHCVKAYSDLLELLVQTKYTGKILVHDFRGNLDEAHALSFFDVYFSFGKSLFMPDQKVTKNFKNISRDRIFLETDDQDEFSIEDIYYKAADLLELEMSACKALFIANLQRFFLDVNNVSSSDVIDNLRGST